MSGLKPFCIPSQMIGFLHISFPLNFDDMYTTEDEYSFADRVVADHAAALLYIPIDFFIE